MEPARTYYGSNPAMFHQTVSGRGLVNPYWGPRECSIPIAQIGMGSRGVTATVNVMASGGPPGFHGAAYSPVFTQHASLQPFYYNQPPLYSSQYGLGVPSAWPQYGSFAPPGLPNPWLNYVPPARYPTLPAQVSMSYLHGRMAQMTYLNALSATNPTANPGPHLSSGQAMVGQSPVGPESRNSLNLDIKVPNSSDVASPSQNAVEDGHRSPNPKRPDLKNEISDLRLSAHPSDPNAETLEEKPPSPPPETQNPRFKAEPHPNPLAQSEDNERGSNESADPSHPAQSQSVGYNSTQSCTNREPCPRSGIANLPANFQKVNDLLVKLFLSRPVTKNDCILPDGQQRIVCAVLVRKFGRRLQKQVTDGMFTDSPESYKKAFKLISIDKAKEALKLILCRVVRKLKNDYFQRTGVGEDHVLDFYQHYFQEISEKAGQPLNAYFYPFEGNNRYLRNLRIKDQEVKFDYYERIFSSPAFLADTLAALPKIRDEHAFEVRLKLHRLMTKWRFSENFNDDEWAQAREWTVKFLLNNARSKVPFTLVEIDHSIALFTKMIMRVVTRSADPRLEEILRANGRILPEVVTKTRAVAALPGLNQR